MTDDEYEQYVTRVKNELCAMIQDADAARLESPDERIVWLPDGYEVGDQIGKCALLKRTTSGTWAPSAQLSTVAAVAEAAVDGAGSIDDDGDLCVTIETMDADEIAPGRYPGDFTL